MACCRPHPAATKDPCTRCDKKPRHDDGTPLRNSRNQRFRTRRSSQPTTPCDPARRAIDAAAKSTWTSRGIRRVPAAPAETWPTCDLSNRAPPETSLPATPACVRTNCGDKVCVPPNPKCVPRIHTKPASILIRSSLTKPDARGVAAPAGAALTSCAGFSRRADRARPRRPRLVRNGVFAEPPRPGQSRSDDLTAPHAGRDQL